MATPPQRHNRPIRDLILANPYKFEYLYEVLRNPSIPIPLFPMPPGVVLEVTWIARWAEKTSNPIAKTAQKWASLMFLCHSWSNPEVISPRLINTHLNYEGVTQVDLDHWVFKFLQE